MPSEKVKENQEGLKFSGTHQFLVYTDDVHLFEDNRYVKKIPKL
jgi:hypothetical protein